MESDGMVGQKCSKCSQCPGFIEHQTWRRVCQYCHCLLESHELSDQAMRQLTNDFQRHCGSTSDNDSGCSLEEYAWIPPGLKPEQVRQYFSCLPEHKIPYLNSAGEKYRMRQLLWQLPPQDTDSKLCKKLSDEEKVEHDNFNGLRKSTGLGRAMVRHLPLTMTENKCHKCEDVIHAGEVAIFAARMSSNSLWHPACFTCERCDELLVDLMYFHKDGSVYCGRHYAELYKPRCVACDEIIFSTECTEAEQKCWHMHHFTCFQCHMALGGQRYVMRQSKPYCCQCFENKFSEFCDTCNQQICVDQGQMTHAGQHWHATDHCFKCYTCQKSLLMMPFLPKNGVVYCSAECSRGTPANNRNSYDSANDSLPSNNNSNEDLQRLLSAERIASPDFCKAIPSLQQPGNAMQSGTYSSEGYGSLSKNICTPLDARVRIGNFSTSENEEEQDEEESHTTELLTRSQMIEARSKRRRSLHNLKARQLNKSSTCSKLSELQKEHELQCKDHMTESKLVAGQVPTGGIRRRASLPTHLNRHMYGDLDSSSSSDDSDSDAAYDAEVIRSNGLSKHNIGDTTPTSTQQFSCHRKHQHSSNGSRGKARSNSLNGSCKVQ